MDILKFAVDAAKKNNISTIVVASTTGNTGLKLLELVKEQNLQMIVVTHDESKPAREKGLTKISEGGFLLIKSLSTRIIRA